MFRALFGEPPRVDSGRLLEAFQAIRQFDRTLDKVKQHSTSPPDRFRRLDIWTSGFLDSLNELEESIYCCGKFRSKLTKRFIDEMDEEELRQYRCHIYFYKNSFVRTFSNLDKLGYFLNELYELHTERIKSRFSYFSMLRRMQDKQVEPELVKQLTALKLKYRESLDRLRNQRNAEIHLINVDQIDELIGLPIDRRDSVQELDRNLHDLHSAFDMVCQTLCHAFTFGRKALK